MKKIITSLGILGSSHLLYAQIIYPQGGAIGGFVYTAAAEFMPEHGFLPGKKFPLYETVEKFDFNGKRVKIVFYDDRKTLNLDKIDCSKIGLTNSSEFKDDQGIVKVWEYLNKLANDSKLVIDKDATDEYEIRLMALDTRLIGFGSIDVHGMTQIKVTHNGVEKIYCTDLEDGDKNAPLDKSSFVSRKTATRLMMSASIRETIEKFLKDISTQ
ncbi:MAG: hypothetical protein ACOVRK_00915 [Chryseobacterium taeanense]